MTEEVRNANHISTQVRNITQTVQGISWEIKYFCRAVGQPLEVVQLINWPHLSVIL